MCCIDVCPIQFLAWAKPIIEKKEANYKEAKRLLNERIAEYKALPWYKKLVEYCPHADMFITEDILGTLGHWKLPRVGRDKYIPLASYCAAKGIKMPLETSHDFFKG